MPERLHPGVYVEEVPPAVRAIEGISTSTAAFADLIEECQKRQFYYPIHVSTLRISQRCEYNGFTKNYFLTI